MAPRSCASFDITVKIVVPVPGSLLLSSKSFDISFDFKPFSVYKSCLILHEPK